MANIGERRHSGSHHEAPNKKKRKIVDQSPSLKRKLEELKTKTIVMVESCRVSDAEKQERDSQLQQIKQDFEHLHQAIVAQQETLEEMQSAIDEDGNAIEDLRERVRTLEVEVEKLKKELSACKVDEFVQVMTSVANVFEMAICWHVMPEFYTGDKLTSRVQDVHDYIHGIKDPPFCEECELEKTKEHQKQRWDDVCQKLRWPIKWERDKPPLDLKMLEMIASLSNGRKCVSSSPIDISEAIEKTGELKGLPSSKTKVIVEFLVEIPSKLACCGLDYKNQWYYT